MSSFAAGRLTIGTRGSKLALAQTELVRQALAAAHPGLEIVLERITTRGDIVLDRPLSAVGGKGLFVDEIEQALRQGRIDLAVHSAKDLPSTLPPDMALAAFLRRADPRDALVSRDGRRMAELPAGARVGTSSVRRACQLRHLRPDLSVQHLRGNVDTRLRKLSEGQYDAIILAAAGLERLDALGYATEILEPEIMLPAVGQGALAVEVRAGDEHTAALLQPLDDWETRVCVTAERAFLAHLAGGCQVPAGALARLAGDRLLLAGMIGTPDGRIVRGEMAGLASHPEEVGAHLAEELLAQGGRNFLLQRA